MRAWIVAALICAGPVGALAQDGGAEGGAAEGSAAPSSGLPGGVASPPAGGAAAGGAAAAPVEAPTSVVLPPPAEPAAPPRPAMFADDFEAPGVHQAKWDVASGAWNIQHGAAYTRSENFRAYTRAYAFQDAEITFDLVNQGLTDPTVGWHGVHVFLRRSSDLEHYLVSVNRADHTAFIVKKAPGGFRPVNGGTYYELASVRFPVEYNRTQQVRIASINNPDGTVSIALWVDGQLVVKARDRGVGGRTLAQPGSIGFRGDYAGFLIDNLAVRRLVVQKPPFGAPLMSGDGDMLDLAVPEEPAGAVQAPFVPQAPAPGPGPAASVIAAAAPIESMDAVAGPGAAAAAAGAPAAAGLDAPAAGGLSSAGAAKSSGLDGVHRPVPRRVSVHRRRERRRR
ncbi:MAG: hypothetical protein HY925_09340 [Elusimicrobia bacterium]|nr:hypothetical protein [Elusimicrobiota bacterium]